MSNATATANQQNLPFHNWKFHDSAKQKINSSLHAEIEQYTKEFLSLDSNTVFKGLFKEHGALEMFCFVKDLDIINPSKFISSTIESAQSVVDVFRYFSGHTNELDALLEFFERKGPQTSEFEILTVLSGTEYPSPSNIELCVSLLSFVREKLACALNDFNRSAYDTDTIALSIAKTNTTGIDSTPTELREFMVMFIENIEHFVISGPNPNKPKYSEKTLNVDHPIIQVAGLIGINKFMKVIASPLSEQALPPVCLLKEVVVDSNSYDELACVAAHLYLEEEYNLVFDVWGKVLASTVQKLNPSLSLMYIARFMNNNHNQRKELLNQDCSNSKRLFEVFGVLLVGAAAMALKESYVKDVAPLHNNH